MTNNNGVYGQKIAGFILLCLFLFTYVAPTHGKAVTVSVNGKTPIATTDDNFVCTTIDWWPPQKCNYGWCPWGNSSIINLDLKNQILINAVKEYGSMRIRLGGSPQDQVVYRFGIEPPRCHNFKKDDDGLFGFSEACLTKSRWHALHRFFKKTGAIVTFGLNALNGRSRRKINDTQHYNSTIWLYEGDWDSNNARDFIAYNAEKGIDIEYYELGNELAGGVTAVLKADQYGKDLIKLKQVIHDAYQNSSSKTPKLMAPASFYDSEWFALMLNTSGPGVIDVLSHHIYNLGPGNDAHLLQKIQDPNVLNNTAQTYINIENTIREFGPWTSAWVGESGGAYNSGGDRISNTFIDGFWFLDQLGQTASYNHKAFCRQALIGGNYALLNTTTFVPNPDYYGGLLWHRLMGSNVLKVSHSGGPNFRAYAHCSKDKDCNNEGAVTLLLINLSNSTSLEIFVNDGLNTTADGVREEYILTPHGGLQSQVLELNGVPLKLTETNEIPPLAANIVVSSTALVLSPSSMAFVKLRGFNASACN